MNRDSSNFLDLSEFGSRIKNIRDLIMKQETFNEQAMYELCLKIIRVLRNGGKIGFIGNGGSAAEAMHLAAEFTGKCVKEHKPLNVICLNESVSAITAIGNDFGFDKIFSRLIQAEMGAGDLLIALSTSGTSLNIQEALKTAVQLEIEAYLWMGDHTLSYENVEIWKVQSTSTPRVQEIHLMWGHMISEFVEMHFD